MIAAVTLKTKENFEVNNDSLFKCIIPTDIRGNLLALGLNLMNNILAKSFVHVVERIEERAKSTSLWYLEHNFCI